MQPCVLKKLKWDAKPKRKWMFASKAGILCVFLFLIGCNKRLETRNVPATEAHQDGFEVVVLENGDCSKAQSLRLGEAEKSLADHPENTFLIPSDKIDSVKEALDYALAQGKNRSEPFTVINVSQKNAVQIIDLSFHYSKSTYHYCYEAHGKTVTPLWSSYQDLASYKKTIYLK